MNARIRGKPSSLFVALVSQLRDGIKSELAAFAPGLRSSSRGEIEWWSLRNGANSRFGLNAVNPGVVVTNIHKRGGMEDEAYNAFLEHSKTTHPIGRVGTADEVADLIYYLASDKASWITGATYEIDGGRAQTCAR